jgi:hypothetical protein
MQIRKQLSVGLGCLLPLAAHAAPATSARTASTKAPRRSPARPAAPAARPAAPRAGAAVAAAGTPAAPPPAGGTAEDARDARIRALEETVMKLQESLTQREKEAAPAKDPRIEALEATVQALQQRVQELTAKAETAPPAAPEPAPVPAPAPEGPAPAEPAPASPESIPGAPTPGTSGGATLLPNISAIGNVIFRAGPKGTENRGRFNLDEAELAFQDRVAPNLRADFFFSAEKGEQWTTGVEEGYLTWSNPLSIQNLSTRFGKVRTPFGKLNPQHPHTWRFVDQPSVITAFLGPDGLNSDGALLQYLLPIPGLFANLEFGGWQTASSAENGRGFAGQGRAAYSARLWFGKEVGQDRELELGFSRYQGKGQPEPLTDRRRLALNGVDLTFRAFPGAYRRIVVQGEAIQSTTSGPGSDRNRWGGYLDLAYRPNQYYEAGVRGDSTRFPYPTKGQESAISAYFTRFLTEQTSVRLQLRHGSRPEESGFTEFFMQFLFGFGPHSHLLQ